MAEPALDLSEIIDLYKEDAKRMVEKMRGALLQWDDIKLGGAPRQELRKLSHQLRGSGRTYGFCQVTRVSKAIENIMLKLETSKVPADERARKTLFKKIERLASLFAA